MTTTLLEDPIFRSLAREARFAPCREVVVARAPGRLDFFGGNVDYTGGLVLQTLVEEGIWVAVQMREDGVLHIRNPQAAASGWETDYSCGLEDLAGRANECLQIPSRAWVAYLLGCLCWLQQRGYGFQRRGAEIFVLATLPANKGVSSSAALTIATLKAASCATGNTLRGEALATASQWVENEIVGAACGIMDQAAIVFGQHGAVLPLLCRPLLVGEALPLPGPLCLWSIDSMAPRSTRGTAYERARAAAFMAYKMLCDHEGRRVEHVEEAGPLPRWRDARWNGYLSACDPAAFAFQYLSLLPEKLSGREFLLHHWPHVDSFTPVREDWEYPVRGAAQYAVEENARIAEVFALLSKLQGEHEFREGEELLVRLGQCMYASHEAYRWTGLGSDRCDELVWAVAEAGPQAGLYGAKMSGGGGGGMVLVLGRPEAGPLIESIAAAYGARYGIEHSIYSGTSAGADAYDCLRWFREA